MKKKVMLAIGGTMMVSAFAFSGLVSNGHSLNQLRAKAEAAASYCTPTANSDCKSDATGNIYPGYASAPYPASTLE